MTRWYGKYRGTVRGPAPGAPAGSVLVNVPEVMGAVGQQSALPCFPYAGKLSGAFVVPPIGANVWVEFEGGDARKPIWVGGFYPLPVGGAGTSVSPPGVEAVVIQTTLMNMLSIIDVPGPTGGIMLKAASGAFILINDAGIILQDGKGGMITMTGTVSINPPNLVVLP